jgi:hypothetical protein
LDTPQRITLVANRNLVLLLAARLAAALGVPPEAVAPADASVDVRALRRGVVVHAVARLAVAPQRAGEREREARGSLRLDFVRKTATLALSQPRSSSAAISHPRPPA